MRRNLVSLILPAVALLIAACDSKSSPTPPTEPQIPAAAPPVVAMQGGVTYSPTTGAQPDMTATDIASGQSGMIAAAGPPVGVPAQVWSLFGNRKSDPAKDKLGTTDHVDLVLVTDNKERLRITADGDINIKNSLEVGEDLTVKNSVFLNTVGGATNNMGPFTVSNTSPTLLTGTLAVQRATTLSSTLSVAGATTLDNTLDVAGATTLNNRLAANGQVTINTSLTGGDGSFNAYPLRVQGSPQGIAIRVNGSRNTSNNFVSFFDAGGMHGRIEGQTSGELAVDPEYIFQNAVLIAQEAIAIADQVAATTSSTTGLAGPVPVVTIPIPSLIVAAAANLIQQTAQLAGYNAFKHANIGVTYQSGAGDYAEWLPKSNVLEKLYQGDIIGVKGGVVSLSTTDAEQILVISERPIVLGNMPEAGMEGLYEKVAFLGQVAVKVMGPAERGDFIVASGNNDGFGKAVSPRDMRPADYENIVGIAWSSAYRAGFNRVNVSVGLNGNSVAKLVTEQRAEIDDLKEELKRTQEILAELVPGYREALAKKTFASTAASRAPVVAAATSTNPRLHELTRTDIIAGIRIAQERMRSAGEDVDRNPFFRRLQSDSLYREAAISTLLAKYNGAVRSRSN